MNNKKKLVLTIVFAVILIALIVMSITSLALLQKTTDKLEKLEQNSNSTNTALKAQVTDLLTQITDLESKLTLADGTIATLTTQINDLKDKLDTANGTITDLTDKLVNVNAEITALLADVTDLTNQIKELSEKAEISDAEIADLTDKLAVTTFKLETVMLKSNINALEQQIVLLFTKSDKEIVIDEFIAEIDEIKGKVASYKTDIDALTPPNDELASLKTDLYDRHAQIIPTYDNALRNYSTIAVDDAALKIVANTLDVLVIPTFANDKEITVNAQRANADAVNRTVTGVSRITMPVYGIYDITLSTGDNTKTVKNLSIYADSYNFVALNATLPVTMLTLDLWNINTAPTYVFLERVNSWNWNQLPENVYAFGEISQTAFHDNRAKMQAYIGELYKANPNAHFTLYTNDIYTENSLWLYQHNIPEANFDINLMSDGAASYNYFNTYLGKNSIFNQDIYDEMKAEWNTAKTRAKAGKSLAECVAGFKYVNANSPFSTLRYYSYVVANEESNIKWLLARPGLLNGHDAGLLPSKSSIVSVNMGTQLTNITNNGLEDELKALFNFDQDAFADGIASGKKIMMLVGTSTEYDVYTKFLMFYCGNDYYIYYKGHPKMQTNTSLIDKYEAMGIDASINMSIPAELLIFYNPTISAAGYPSSTFQNIDSDCKVLFASKAAIHNDPTKQYRAEVYISIVANTSNKIVKVEYEANDEVKYWSMDTNDYCENPNA